MIILRPLEPEDLDALYEIENNPKDWQHSSNNVPYSRYALHDYIANQSCDIYTDKQIRLVICEDTNPQEVIGLADLINFDPSSLRAEMGLIIRNCYRHKGYAIPAVEALKQYASRKLHLNQIYAIISESNNACISLFSKIDFHHSATLEKWFFIDDFYQNALIFQHFLKKV